LQKEGKKKPPVEAGGFLEFDDAVIQLDRTPSSARRIGKP
jgi:hypothetical protein